MSYISGDASSPNAFRQAGLLLGLLVPLWYSTTCPCTGTDPSPALDIPQGKSSCEQSGGRDRSLRPSATISGSVTQGLWPAMCQLPGTATHPSIC